MADGALAGIVLAAGAGRRMGRPKALVRDDSGTPWLELAVAVLRAAGSSDIVVVLGAAARDARALVPADARVVEAADWASGQAASLRTGLDAVAGGGAAAALVTLVDLPSLPAAVARRVVGGGVVGSGFDGATLRQAVFDGRPGHPVLIGRDHWPALIPGLGGDRGARPYLVAHGVTEVECSDLSPGEDVDVLPGS
jgi:CTP:molybdopterin cytidylyltransferase MocA